MRESVEEFASAPIVDIRHATVCRGEQPVLHNCSLKIDRGCSTVILGPNGAGKSTLIKLLSRELYPVITPGVVVRLFGKASWNIWSLRRQLGIVSADLHHEYWRMTSGIDVVLSGFFSSVDLYDHQVISHFQRAQSYAMMEQLGVASCAEQPFSQSSTGEQRRMLLARALVHEPSTLILDEPTTGLDVSACFQYLEIIRGFMREGGTVILVTHHIHEIPPEMNQVVLLQEGRIQNDGPKGEVLNAHSLSMLFNTPIELLHRRGWFQVIPATSR